MFLSIACSGDRFHSHAQLRIDLRARMLGKTKGEVQARKIELRKERVMPIARKSRQSVPSSRTPPSDLWRRKSQVFVKVDGEGDEFRRMGRTMTLNRPNNDAKWKEQ